MNLADIFMVMENFGTKYSINMWNMDWSCLAQTASERGYNFGKMVGSYSALFICLPILLVNLKHFKNPQANKKCITSVEILMMLMILNVIFTFLKIEGTDLRSAVILLLFRVVVQVVCLLLAVIGLLEISKSETQKYGKKQAIPTLVISLLVICGLITNLVRVLSPALSEANVISKEQTNELTFENLNFKYHISDSKYIVAKPELINKDACMAIIKKDPEILFLIVAEKIGVENGVKADTIKEISQSYQKSAASQVKFNDLPALQADGLDGVAYVSEYTPNGQQFFLSYNYIYVNNGYVYNLVTIGNVKNRSIVSSEAIKLVGGFSLLDRQAVFSTFEPFTEYTSATYGYSLAKPDYNWSQWPTFKEEYPEADFGGQNVYEDCYFQIVPIILEDDQVDEKILFEAMLTYSDIKIDAKNESDIKPLTLANASGFQLITKRKHMSEDVVFYSNLIKGENRVLFLTTWSSGEQSKVEELNKELLDKISLAPFNKVDDISSLPLVKSEIDNHANAYNKIGMALYGKEMFDKALTYFVRASELDRSVSDYINNAAETCVMQRNYKKGYQLTQEYLEINEDDMQIEGWSAYFLSEMGEKEQALALYQKIFKNGYRDDDDFMFYADLAATSLDVDQINAMFADYKKGGSNINIEMKHIGVLRDRHYEEQACELLEPLWQSNKYSADYGNELADCYIELEEFNKALELCNVMIENKIQDGSTFFLKGLAQYGLKWYKDARESLVQASKIQPESAVIRQYLDHVTSLLGKGDNSNIQKEIAPAVIPDKVLAMVNSLPELNVPADSHIAYEFFIKCLSFAKEKNYISSTYKKIKALDSVGVSGLSTLEYDFDPLSENIYVNYLKVYDAQGELVVTGNIDNYYVIEKQDGQIYSYDKTLHITVPGLTVGGSVECCVTKERRSLPDAISFDRHYLGSSYPCRLGMVVYVGDKNLLSYSTQNNPVFVEAENYMYWYVTDGQAILREPLQVVVDYLCPVVYFSGRGDTWQKVAQDYYQELDPLLLADQAVDQVVTGLVAGKTSDTEKMYAIYEFVQKNFTYKALEFGIRGRTPNSPGVTLANKFGDCKDQAVLLCNMLKNAGINSKLVLVNSSLPVIEELPSLDQFDHMIVCAAIGDDRFFLDPTNKEFCSKMNTPSGLGGGKALLLGQTDSNIVTIGDYQDQAMKVDVVREIKINDAGSLDIKERIAFCNYSGEFMRRYFKETDKASQDHWYQLFIDELNLDGAISSAAVDNVNDNNSDMILTLDYSVKQKLDHEFNLLIPHYIERSYIETPHISQRTSSFEVRYPLVINSSIIIENKSDAKLVFDPEVKVSGSSEFGSYSSDITEKGDSVVIELKFNGIAGRFDKDKYSDMVDFSDKALKVLLSSIKLQKADNTAKVSAGADNM